MDTSEALEVAREHAGALMPGRKAALLAALEVLEGALGGSGRQAKDTKDRKERGGKDRGE